MNCTRIAISLFATLGTLILLPALAPLALAQQPAGIHAKPNLGPSQELAPKSDLAPKTSLANFAWLEGRWRGEWGPRIAEQVWMAPKAGLMVGMFRLVENDKTLVLEMFTLVEKPDEIDFYFRHFTPELVPWEKSDATILKLASFDAGKIDLENPVDGMPKRAILTRVDTDTYTSRSEIIPEQGDPQIIEITYHRQK